METIVILLAIIIILMIIFICMNFSTFSYVYTMKCIEKYFTNGLYGINDFIKAINNKTTLDALSSDNEQSYINAIEINFKAFYAYYRSIFLDKTIVQDLYMKYCNEIHKAFYLRKKSLA